VQVLDDGRRLVAPVTARGGLATAVIRALDGAGVTVDDVEVHRPSLDDVFFALTGRPAESSEPSDAVDGDGRTAAAGADADADADSGADEAIPSRSDLVEVRP
jgi:ABC-2 type transport system ATP-binding protein